MIVCACCYVAEPISDHVCQSLVPHHAPADVARAAGFLFAGAAAAMMALGKRFEHHTFAGAGHGFLRQQEGQAGANLTAAQQAWPLTIAFFRSTLGR